MEELPPLLHLLPLVRRRNHRFVGLVPFSNYPYEIELHNGKVRWWLEVKPSIFYGLLLSCRTIHAEAAALLYSANRFVLRYDPTRSEPFGPLRALTTIALASLASLTIILNQASCHQKDKDYSWCCLEGHDFGPFWGGVSRCIELHFDSHQLPLLSRPPHFQPKSDFGTDLHDSYNDQLAIVQALVAKWHLAATCLSRITTRRLKLVLVCDIDPCHTYAAEIASLVTAPLRLIPQLDDCRIRLGKFPDPRLQKIARDSVLQACRIPPPPYDSPRPSTRTLRDTLISLPREIRLRILEYTDLIAPNREVTWSRQDQRYAISATNWYTDSGLRPFFCYWEVTRTRGFIGCFCRRRHASFSFKCKCWAPPGPTLCLVCRTLYHDAQLTFFSGNRFIVHDYKDHPCWVIPSLGEESDSDEEFEGPQQLRHSELGAKGSTSQNDYPADRFAASQFLREVVPVHCLAYLRFLELVFPSYLAQTWARGEHPVMQDWHATVDWLPDKINAPGLTIRLVVAEVSCDSPRAYRKVIPRSDGDIIGNAHMKLAFSLKPLADNGLARFYVHLSYPWEFTVEPYIRRERWLVVKRLKRELKERVERYIMGDRYGDLYANGRKEPCLNFWKKAYYCLQ